MGSRTLRPILEARSPALCPGGGCLELLAYGSQAQGSRIELFAFEGLSSAIALGHPWIELDKHARIEAEEAEPRVGAVVLSLRMGMRSRRLVEECRFT